MQTEIEESNRHSRQFWKIFAQTIPGGEVFERDGLSIANAKQPWFFMNLGMLNRPIADQFVCDTGHKKPWTTLNLVTNHGP